VPGMKNKAPAKKIVIWMFFLNFYAGLNIGIVKKS
jgi:hypothetical protein